MRILQISAYYPPSFGGVQTYVESLSTKLSEMGHEVTIFSTSPDHRTHKTESSQSIPCRVCLFPRNFRIYRAVISYDLLKALLAAKEYDVYHIHIPFHFGLETSIVSSLIHNIPLIATHHGEGFSGSLRYAIIAQAYSFFYRRVSMQFSDRIVFLTRSYSEEIRLSSEIRDRVRVVPTGANIERFLADGSGRSIRRKFNIDERSPIILFVGSLTEGNEYKGVEYLISSLPLVRIVIPKVKLLIVGGGELLPGFKDMAQEMELEDRIIFAGPVPNPELPEFYSAADLLVLPSTRGPENSPVVVFEGMAAGKPVVASNLPGVRDIVVDGKTGILVSPQDIDLLADAIVKVLRTPELRERMGRAARSRAEAYTWDHCAKRMVEIYEEVRDREDSINR